MMANDNIGIYTNPAHDIAKKSIPIPDLKPHECLVHVRATGICGSDIHFWKHGRVGPTMVVESEVILGHESSGVVEAIGSQVTRFKVGDRVAIEPGIPCGKASCKYCRIGRYNACPEMQFKSTPPLDGLLRRYVAHSEDWLHKMPDNLSFEDGALLEPLCVVLAGVERAELRIAQPTVILGAGPIGLAALAVAKAAGACPLLITDIDPERLKLAKSMCSYVHTLQIKDVPAKDNAATIKSMMGVEPELAIDCTGIESSIEIGIESVCFGGSVFVIGVGRDVQSYPFMTCSVREVTLKFQYRYHETWPKAIQLMSHGVVNLRPLITHRVKLEDAVSAFHTAIDKEKKAVKVIIYDDDDDSK